MIGRRVFQFVGLQVAISYLFLLAIINEPDLKNLDTGRRSISVVSPRSIPVFYNMYSNPEDKKYGIASTARIFKEQMSLLLQEHNVFVRSIGAQIDVVVPPDVTLIQHEEEGDETGTLHLLWNYCKNSTDDTVVYIHNKGSFHPSYQNTLLRRFLTRGALSEECMDMPSFCNVCSSRMSPLPHPHTPGNMWAAKCEYIQQLIDPIELSDKMDAIFPHLNMMHASCVGGGRFAAEHWVHSHPSVQPCDLSTNEKYTWGYYGIPLGKFKMDLKPAPRYAMNNYEKPGCWGAGKNTFWPRMIEYKALYNETPSESWWGWDFYNIRMHRRSTK